MLDGKRSAEAAIRLARANRHAPASSRLTSVLTTRCKYTGYYLAPAKAEEAREESPASTTLGSYGMSGIRSTLIRVAVIVARSPPATRLPLGSNRSEIATAV